MKNFVFIIFYPIFFILFGGQFFCSSMRYEVPANLGQENGREVAEDSHVHCSRMYELLLQPRLSERPAGKFQAVFDFFRQQFGSKRDWKNNFEINFHEYMFFRKEFVDILEQGETVPVRFIKAKPEALLAFIQAMNKKHYLNIDDQVRNLSYLQKRRITKLFHTINDRTKWSMQSMEDVISDLLYETIGPEAKVFSKEIMDDEKAHRRLLMRILMEEVTFHGLEKAYAYHPIFPGGMNKVRAFFSGSVGQTLITLAMWSPALWGMTPLPYMPKLKKLRIPQELLDEIMDKGVTNEFLEKLDRTMRDTLNISYTSNLSGRARYDVLRRRINRYVIPTVIFWGVMADYMAYQEEMDIYNREGEYLDEKLDEVTSIFTSIQELDDIGVNIYNSVSKVKVTSGYAPDENSQDIENREVMSNHVCRDLIDCYEYKSIMVGVDILDRTNPEHLNEIKECKTEFDPETQCPQL